MAFVTPTLVAHLALALGTALPGPTGRVPSLLPPLTCARCDVPEGVTTLLAFPLGVAPAASDFTGPPNFATPRAGGGDGAGGSNSGIAVLVIGAVLAVALLSIALWYVATQPIQTCGGAGNPCG